MIGVIDEKLGKGWDESVARVRMWRFIGVIG